MTATPPPTDFYSDLHGTVRWLLPDDALRINGLIEHDDGTIQIPVEIARPGPINRFMATKQLLDNMVAQKVADLVNDHMADVDGRADHIFGRIENPQIEAGTGALVAILRTFKSPTGLDFAELVKEHIKAVRAGLKGIIALSIGVRDVILADGVDFTDEPPWDAISGIWDHVMMTRADFQAQPNAGIRASMGDALEDYFKTRITAAREGLSNMEGAEHHPEPKSTALNRMLNQAIDKMVTDDRSRSDIVMALAKAAGIGDDTVNKILSGRIRCPPLDRIRDFARVLSISFNSLKSAGEKDGCPYGDDTAEGRDENLISTDGNGDSSMSGEDNPDTPDAKLQAKLDASAKEQKALQTKLDAAEKATKAATAETERLQGEKDDARKAQLIERITDIHGKLDTEVPKVKREDGSEVELANATIAEVEPLHLAALEAFAGNPPKLIDRTPPKDPNAGKKKGEPDPIKGLFEDVPRATTGSK